MLSDEQRTALAALPHGVWSGTPDEWDEYLFAAGIAYAQTEAAAELARLTVEVQRLQRERAERNKTDPVTRLHNLCDALAEDRDTSPYSQQAWDAQDEAYREKCKEVERLRADAERWRLYCAWQNGEANPPTRWADYTFEERVYAVDDVVMAAIKEAGNG